MADRERLAPGRRCSTEDAGRRLPDLQLEGIREAPLGVVVCCDRRTPGGRRARPGHLPRRRPVVVRLRHREPVAGRPRRGPRARLGHAVRARPSWPALLHLPDGVVTLGWLCLGWPDERPPGARARAGRLVAPRAARRRRAARPLARRGPPAARRRTCRAARPGRRSCAGATGPTTCSARPVARRPRPGRRPACWRWPAASLGTGRAGGRWCSPAPTTRSPRTASRPTPPSVTRDVLRAAVAGEALGAVTADAQRPRRGRGRRRCRRRPGRGRRTTPGPRRRAATSRTARRCVPRMSTGWSSRRPQARPLGGGGPVALGEVGVGNTTVAAALAAALLGRRRRDRWSGSAPAPTRPCSSASVAVVDRGRPRRPGRGDPRDLLGALGGGEFAVLTGVVLGAAAGRRRGRPRRAGHHGRRAARRAASNRPSRRIWWPATAAARPATRWCCATWASSRCSTCGCVRVKAWERRSRPAWYEMR